MTGGAYGSQFRKDEERSGDPRPPVNFVGYLLIGGVGGRRFIEVQSKDYVWWRV